MGIETSGAEAITQIR